MSAGRVHRCRGGGECPRTPPGCVFGRFNRRVGHAHTHRTGVFVSRSLLGGDVVSHRRGTGGSIKEVAAFVGAGVLWVGCLR